MRARRDALVGRVPVCRRLAGDAGATMVEYAFMVMLIAIVAFAAVAALGGSVTNIFCTLGAFFGGGGC